MNIIVRPATQQDIPQVARIHKDQFPTHFLGKYSVTLLEKFYSSFLGSCIFIVSEQAGMVKGFVLGGYGSTLSAARSKFVTENKMRYCMETVLRPQVYLQALARLKALWGLLKQSNNKAKPQTNDEIRLLSIAVSGNTQGSGVAKLLVQAFEKEVASGSEYGLSVMKDNERAIRFYYKMGFEFERESTDSIYFRKYMP